MSLLISFTCFPQFLCFNLCFISLLHHFLHLCFLSFSFPFTLHYSLSCCALSCPHCLHLWFPRRRAEVHKTLSATVHDFFIFFTPTHRCQPGDWLSFPPSIFFFHSLLALCSLYSSPSVLSLSAADLWDQPSKTDSHFFTDHECVSGYATEREIEKEREREREHNM